MKYVIIETSHDEDDLPAIEGLLVTDSLPAHPAARGTMVFEIDGAGEGKEIYPA